MDSSPPIVKDCKIDTLTINSNITINTYNYYSSHRPKTPPADVGSNTPSPEEPSSGSPVVNGSDQAVTEERPQLVSLPRPDPSNAEVLCGSVFAQNTDLRSELSGMSTVWCIFYCFCCLLLSLFVLHYW